MNEEWNMMEDGGWMIWDDCVTSKLNGCVTLTLNGTGILR